MGYSKEQILNLLEDVKDPEIPVLDVVEMGIVRDVIIKEDSYRINITPTYSGCPAMKAIEDEIVDVLYSQGIEDVIVKKVYSPPWTTDWLSEETRKKLRDYGIAPPDGEASDDYLDKMLIKKTVCPFCNSENTSITSEFGSTACKSLHYCDGCHQPFEHFKCI